MIVPLLFVATFAQAAPPVATQKPAPAPAAHGSDTTPTYVPQRVYDTRRNAFTDFEAMIADLARADVVFVGEQHDDPNTHRLEHALAAGLLRRGVPTTVSLEMFERDVQARLDDYVAGKISEEEFLKDARPWPRYASDYRPIVETAKAHGWPVVAANVPRRLASLVAKSGKGALDTLPAEDRPFVARDLQCPLDRYYARFAEQMGAHPGGSKTPTDEERAAQQAMTERYYWSQCLKDETMAESIVEAFAKQGARPGPIVHYNGSFHSDYGMGTAERVRRRLPGRRVAVVTMRPVENLDTLAPAGDDITIADYIVYTVK